MQARKPLAKYLAEAVNDYLTCDNREHHHSFTIKFAEFRKNITLQDRAKVVAYQAVFSQIDNDENLATQVLADIKTSTVFNPNDSYIRNRLIDALVKFYWVPKNDIYAKANELYSDALKAASVVAGPYGGREMITRTRADFKNDAKLALVEKAIADAKLNADEDQNPGFRAASTNSL